MEIKKLSDSVHGNGNFVLYGPSGSGKTFSISTLPKDSKPLILAAEKGLRTLVDMCPDMDVANINSMEDMRKAFDICKESDHDIIVIDSLSEVADFALLEAKSESKDGRQHYMMMADKVSGLIRHYNDDLKQTVIYICQEERVNSEDLGVLDYVYAPAIPGRKFATKVPYKLDYVFCLRTKLGEDDKVERAIQTSLHGDYLAKARANHTDGSPKLAVFEDADWSAIFNKLNNK